MSGPQGDSPSGAGASTNSALASEARTGKLAATAAVLSAGLAVASAAVQLSAVGAKSEDRSETLTRFDEHRSEAFLSLGLQVASYFMLAGALFYLLRATMHRRSETPGFATGLLLLAPILLTLGGLLSQLQLTDVVDEFLASPDRSDSRAKALLEDQGILGGAIGSGGILCLALSFVLISLNAMRAGLLSRFMGVLGIIAGSLLVLPVLALPVVQVFWLVALAALFLDRWPGGRGPAWETGEAIPWPSAAEARGEALAASMGSESADDAEPDGAAPPRPVSRKRKKKRR